MAVLKIALVIFFLYYKTVFAVGKDDQTTEFVKTASGNIQGFVSHCATGKTANAYLGIPYGQSTSGALRFQLPEPVIPWKGTLKATALPKSCPQKPFPLERISRAVRQWQIHTPIDEDCLRLNIWTPSTVTSGSSLSVMVWIHGGGFTRGSTSVSKYDGKCLAAEENVILVTVNYRVDSFGYLFLNDTYAPGNMGIFDQQLAMKWVKQNIAYFGGNPDEVTLFGQSAGGVSVGIHLMFPSSRGLFKRGILQSGGPTAKWTYDTKEEAYQKSMDLVTSIGCWSGNVTEIMFCLQRASVEEILYHEPAYGYDDIFVFTNVVDGNEMSDDPNNMLDKHKFQNMDIMTGAVANEGNIFLPGQMPVYFNAQTPKTKITRKNFRAALQEFTKLEGEEQREVEHIYYDNVDKSNCALMSESIEQVISDTFFTCSANKISQHFAEAGNKVFNYFFTHRSSNTPWAKWVGVPHGEEILYIFGDPLDPNRKYTQEETAFSRKIMRSWSNFAKFGDPRGNETDKDSYQDWPQYTTKKKEYLELSPRSKGVGSRLREKQCEFWEGKRPYVMPPRSPLELFKLFGF